MSKLSKKKLEELCRHAFKSAAGGSHDHIMETVHDEAESSVDDLLKESGIKYDILPEEQQVELTEAYKLGFWEPGKPWQPDWKPFKFNPNKMDDQTSGNNGLRALNGCSMVALVDDFDHNEPTERITDAIANILHFADQQGMNTADLLRTAEHHWLEER